MEMIYLPEGSLAGTAQNTEYTRSLEGLEYARNNRIILEAKAVLCDASHNLHVELGMCRGIIPCEEAAYNALGDEVKDIAIITRVGKNVCFVVTDIKEQDGEIRVLLSRREAQKMCCENYISMLENGDIINAAVTHMEPFGAFCDIGCGLAALLPIDCISVSRISHPSQRFNCGMKIRCVVRNIDREICRVTLSHKELLGTWQENADMFLAGETVSGTVRSVEPYGIFVELAPNLAGLAEWCDGVTVGQTAAVYIKSIIPEKMKIKLVIVDTADSGESIGEIRYRYDGSHMDYWKYSPDGCMKEIYSVFD